MTLTLEKAVSNVEIEDRQAIDTIMKFAADLSMTYGEEDPLFFRGNKPEVSDFGRPIVANEIHCDYL